jgi:hypothetical protein
MCVVACATRIYVHISRACQEDNVAASTEALKAASTRIGNTIVAQEDVKVCGAVLVVPSQEMDDDDAIMNARSLAGILLL